MAVGDAHVFPGFLTPVLTQLFFPKPATTFLTCFCRGEWQKHAREKVCLNRGSNSKRPGHESDMLTTEPPRQGKPFEDIVGKREMLVNTFSNLPITNFEFSVTFMLLSTSSSNLHKY